MIVTMIVQTPIGAQDIESAIVSADCPSPEYAEAWFAGYLASGIVRYDPKVSTIAYLEYTGEGGINAATRYAQDAMARDTKARGGSIIEINPDNVAETTLESLRAEYDAKAPDESFERWLERMFDEAFHVVSDMAREQSADGARMLERHTGECVMCGREHSSLNEIDMCPSCTQIWNS